jgi:hypothetical protein
MNWLEALGDELTARGVRGREQSRIILELHDHIECAPGGELRLGDPAIVAATFADELAGARSRRSALYAFAALSLTALALAVSQFTLGQIGYPGFKHGLTQVLFWPALVGIFIAPQIALVSGTLAAVRAFRRRRVVTMPAAEVALLARRTRVALSAGMATAAGVELYVIDFSRRLPSWWLVLSAGLGVVAGTALIAARRELAGTLQLRSSVTGPAGDLSRDLPCLSDRGWHARPWRLVALATLLVALLVTAVEAHAERSLQEGIQRGLAEAIVAAAGLVLLGRALGILSNVAIFHPGRKNRIVAATGRAMRAPDRVGAPDRVSAPDRISASDRRSTDDDRAEAEGVLRDAFANGQISLDELTDRLTSIHGASTQRELREALSDLL